MKSKLCTQCKLDLPIEKFAILGYRRASSCNVCNGKKYRAKEKEKPKVVYVSRKDRGLE